MSSAANIPVDQVLLENWESIEELDQYKDLIKDDIIPNLLHLRPQSYYDEEFEVKKPGVSPITSKIVKHIRGGSRIILLIYCLSDT